MSRNLWKLLTAAFLLAIVVGSEAWTKASSVIHCSYPGTVGGGGCEDCWLVDIGQHQDAEGGYTITTYLYASCNEYIGDQEYISTSWSAPETPACIEDTVSCGTQVTFYHNDSTSPEGPTCGVAVGSTITAAHSNTTPYCSWLGAPYQGPTSCTKSRRTETAALVTGVNCP